MVQQYIIQIRGGNGEFPVEFKYGTKKLNPVNTLIGESTV